MATPTGTNRPIVYFDGLCGLCDRFVSGMIRRDKKAVFLFASFQGETARAKGLRPGGGSIVLEKDGLFFRLSGASLRILAGVGGIHSLWLLFLAVPAPIRDFFYGLVSKNRYKWFGKRETCRAPKPEERERFLP